MTMLIRSRVLGISFATTYVPYEEFITKEKVQKFGLIDLSLRRLLFLADNYLFQFQ